MAGSENGRREQNEKGYRENFLGKEMLFYHDYGDSYTMIYIYLTYLIAHSYNLQFINYISIKLITSKKEQQ